MVWHGRVRFADWLDERMGKSNCLASSLQEWIKAHRPSMASVPKQTKKGSRPLLQRRRAQSGNLGSNRAYQTLAAIVNVMAAVTGARYKVSEHDSISSVQNTTNH